MSTARRYTYDDYKRARDANELGSVKLEFIDGTIYAMTGSTPAHAQLTTRMSGMLERRLKASCVVYSSDLNIHVEATGLSTYPDLSVICGAPKARRADKKAFVNPSLLVEVLSESTEDYDRGDKLDNYKQIPTLRTVLLVSQWAPEVTLIERVSNGWIETTHSRGSVKVASPRLVLPLRELYRGIELTAR